MINLLVTSMLVGNFATTNYSPVAAGGATMNSPLAWKDVTARESDCHPVFRVDKGDYERAMAQGADLAKHGKSEEEAYSRTTVTPKWTRGGGAPTGDSRVRAVGIGTAPITYQAAHSAKLYEAANLPQSVVQGEACVHNLFFDVYLKSKDTWGPTEAARLSAIVALANALKDPKNAQYYADQILKDVELKSKANPLDTNVLKFVIEDDRGHQWPVAQSDDLPKRTVGTLYGLTPSTDQGPVANLTKTEEYSEQHPCVVQVYAINFPLFDAEGNALIGKDVKRLTLHMVTERGEQTAVFDLGKKGLK